MITLKFIQGGNIRNVTIKDRKIYFTSSETNFEPVTIDLDKVDSKQFKDWKDFIEEIKELENEEEKAKDIIKDFQKTGWRLISKHGST